MPVTSVDIDADLLRRAKAAFGVTTNREAISLALSDAVQRRRQLEAIQALSQLPVDVNASVISYGD